MTGQFLPHAVLQMPVYEMVADNPNSVAEIRHELDTREKNYTDLGQEIHTHKESENSLRKDVDTWLENKKVSDPEIGSLPLEVLIERLEGIISENRRLQRCVDDSYFQLHIQNTNAAAAGKDNFYVNSVSKYDQENSHSVSPSAFKGSAGGSSNLHDQSGNQISSSVPANKYYFHYAIDDSNTNSNDSITRRSQQAKDLVAYYDGNTKEASRAVGIKQTAFEAIRDGTIECSQRKRLMLEHAVEETFVSIQQKRDTLRDVYIIIINELQRRIQQGLGDSNTKKTISRVEILQQYVNELPSATIKGMYWRFQRYSYDTLVEAFIQSNNSNGYEGVRQVLDCVVFDRLVAGSQTYVSGFNEVNTFSEKKWKEGVFIQACANSGQKDANYAYIPKTTLLNILPGNAIPSRLYFLSDEDHNHLHLNTCAMGKEKLPPWEALHPNHTCYPCRVDRNECLLFASKFNKEELSVLPDIYDICTQSNGTTSLKGKNSLIPVVTGLTNENANEELWDPLSKLEVFYGMGIAARDLVTFLRSLYPLLRSYGGNGMKEEGSETDDPFFNLSDPEDDLSEGVIDPKIGTILIRIPVNHMLPLKKERRYVYRSVHCDDTPYYLSKTSNRIFVVDKTRIDYFVDGVEPQEVCEEMRQQAEQLGEAPILPFRSFAVPRNSMTNRRPLTSLTEPSNELEQSSSLQKNLFRPEKATGSDGTPRPASHTLLLGAIGQQQQPQGKLPEPTSRLSKNTIPTDSEKVSDCKRIGSIVIKLGKISDYNVERRVVYRSNNYLEKPFYMTDSGNKIFVLDNSRILLDNPPSQKKRKRPIYL
eukprot:gene6268-4517_t